MRVFIGRDIRNPGNVVGTQRPNPVISSRIYKFEAIVLSNWTPILQEGSARFLPDMQSWVSAQSRLEAGHI